MRYLQAFWARLSIVSLKLMLTRGFETPWGMRCAAIIEYWETQGQLTEVQWKIVVGMAPFLKQFGVRICPHCAHLEWPWLRHEFCDPDMEDATCGWHDLDRESDDAKPVILNCRICGWRGKSYFEIDEVHGYNNAVLRIREMHDMHNGHSFFS